MAYSDGALVSERANYSRRAGITPPGHGGGIPPPSRGTMQTGDWSGFHLRFP